MERAAALGGYPWLLTFSGMADVLGWPKRPPLVPQCHRSMILETWAPYCQGLTPKEHSLPFDKVRTFRPQEFVDLLVEMQVRPIHVLDCGQSSSVKAENLQMILLPKLIPESQAISLRLGRQGLV